MRSARLPRRVRGAAVAGLLAAAMSLPVGLADSPRANAACTIVWGSSYTKTSSVSPATGLTFTTSVTYRLGYDLCHLDTPVKINVQSFRNTMKISGGSTSAVHQDAAGSVLEWFRNYPYDYKIVWNDPTLYRHVGNGTWTRSNSPNVYMWYSSDAAIRGYWTGCSQTGVGKCQMWYRFRKNDWAVRWTL